MMRGRKATSRSSTNLYQRLYRARQVLELYQRRQEAGLDVTTGRKPEDIIAEQTKRVEALQADYEAAKEGA